MLILLIMLVAASCIDLRTHRIPNLLTLSGALLGIGVNISATGLPGLGHSVLGLLLGFGLLLPFYVMRAMGAGDVKLMAAVGSFLGPALTLQAVLYTFLVGGLLAMVAMIRADGLRETASRYGFGLRHLLTTRRWLGQRPGTAEAPRLKFPYALAIAMGTALALYGPALLPIRGG